ncbi:unnamed protein product [Symbiodinium microadriaticum]|nr:unnamed protein product [Symbiodinium sp. KB8]CAE7707444.1 unnamed protein product [Symbiodinium microadriaticum]
MTVDEEETQPWSLQAAWNDDLSVVPASSESVRTAESSAGTDLEQEEDSDWMMPLQEMEAIRDAPTPAWSDRPEAVDYPKVPLVVETARELDIYNHSVQWTWSDPGDPGNEWRPRDAVGHMEEDEDEDEKMEEAEEEGEEEDPCVDPVSPRVAEKALAILAEGKADWRKPEDDGAEVQGQWGNHSEDDWMQGNHGEEWKKEAGADLQNEASHQHYEEYDSGCDMMPTVDQKVDGLWYGWEGAAKHPSWVPHLPGIPEDFTACICVYQ